MAIDFTCACGKEYQLSDDKAGKKAQCGRCGVEFVIPAPPAGAPSMAEAAVDPLAPIGEEPSAPTAPAEKDPFGDLGLEETPPPPRPAAAPSPVMPVGASPSSTGGGAADLGKVWANEENRSFLNKRFWIALLVGLPLALGIGCLWGLAWQIGLLMWAIGGLLGFVVSKITPERSTRVGLLAAGLTLFSIICGTALSVIVVYGLYAGIKNTTRLGDLSIVRENEREAIKDATPDDLRKKLNPDGPGFNEYLFAAEENRIDSPELKAWLLDWDRRVTDLLQQNPAALVDGDFNKDLLIEFVQTPPDELDDDRVKAGEAIMAHRESIDADTEALREYVYQTNQTLLRYGLGVGKAVGMEIFRRDGAVNASGDFMWRYPFRHWASLWRVLLLFCALGTAYRFGAEAPNPKKA